MNVHTICALLSSQSEYHIVSKLVEKIRIILNYRLIVYVSILYIVTYYILIVYVYICIYMFWQQINKKHCV